MISSSAARCTIALTARLPRPTRHIVLNLSARNVSMAASMEEVSPVEAHKLTFGGGGWTFVDVRTVNEFLNDGHAPGALNIPMHVSLEPKQENPEFMVAFENAFPNKDTKLVMGCRSGARSGMACQKLMAAGYTNVKNMAGGWLAWSTEEALPKSNKQ